ncbi:hypothetical protein [Archangium violaceum]|uniref:hypothetical protein n=1 Tax=Archangium violaceum TaxID=83451 RepID=UPI003D2B2484
MGLWRRGAEHPNTPSAGEPHAFFDETRALLEPIPAGAEVKLQKDAQDTEAFYVIDLEQVAAPLEKQQGGRRSPKPRQRLPLQHGADALAGQLLRPLRGLQQHHREERVRGRAHLLGHPHRRIRRMGGVLRERAGAERWRRAADGGRPSGAPGRWRGRAVPLGYTPAQAVLPGGVRQGTWASWLS